jgi:PAS domain S-box-containing protein
VVGTLVDITERREAEAKFRGLVEQALAGIYIVEGGYVRYANPVFAALFGYPSPDALVDRIPLGDLVAPADRERVRENIRLRTSGAVREMHYDFRARRRDGTTFVAEVHGRGFEFQGRPAVIGIIQDVTGRKWTEEALRESEADLRRAQTVGQIGNWRLDVLRNELLWSDENYRIFGAVPGTPQSYDSFLAAVHPDDRAYVDAGWQAALGGEPYDIEHRIVVAGDVRWVRERAELEFNASGALVGGFGTTQEITERKRAEQALQESETTLRTLFANLPGVAYRCELNAPWRVSVISEAVLQVTGYPAAEFLREGGRTWGELVLSDDLPQVEDAVAEGVREHRSYEVEYRIVHANGRLCWVFERGQAVYADNGEPCWLDGVIVDISERKRAEAALERKTKELQRTNAELEEFAYVASHDLKAPLRAVANLALVIDEDAAAGLDEENRSRLRMLRERVIGMDQLIDGLLGYARLGRAARERRPVPLGPLLDETVSDLNLPAGYRVEREGPLPVLTADPLELRQIFQNLIANAVHHHDRGSGTVWVRAHREDQGWSLEVADDGPGIPPLERQQVFRMFSNSGKQGHFGIGLAATRKLVLANGGRIEVTENRPRGALFRIFWPG